MDCTYFNCWRPSYDKCIVLYYWPAQCILGISFLGNFSAVISAYLLHNNMVLRIHHVVVHDSHKCHISRGMVIFTTICVFIFVIIILTIIFCENFRGTIVYFKIYNVRQVCVRVTAGWYIVNTSMYSYKQASVHK